MKIFPACELNDRGLIVQVNLVQPVTGLIQLTQLPLFLPLSETQRSMCSAPKTAFQTVLAHSGTPTSSQTDAASCKVLPKQHPFTREILKKNLRGKKRNSRAGHQHGAAVQSLSGFLETCSLWKQLWPLCWSRKALQTHTKCWII